MSDIYFASLDIGTSGVRAFIVSHSGKIKSKAYREYPCEYPRPGWVEQNVDIMWEKLCEASRDAIAIAGISANSIKSLGISSQRGTFIPVDKEIKPLMNSIVWSDIRANKELNEILQNISKEDYYKISGVSASSLWSYAKIKWFMENEKLLFDKTYKILNGQEYFLKKLGAEELTTDPSSITMSGMLDVANLTWSKDLCKLIDLPIEKLPEVGTPARMVGKISKSAAEKTGFAEGMSIAIGGGDQQCTAVGAGIIKEGMGVVILGTGMALVTHIESIKKDEKRTVIIGGSGIPGKWDMEGIQATGSSTLKWWQENFASIENISAKNLGLDVYKIIDLEAANSPVGSKGLIFFPFFQGQCTPNYDDYAKGGFLGISFIHDKKDMMRAVMEGTSFETNMVKEAMEVVMGKQFFKLRISGGGAKSDLWSHIQADIYGRPVERLEIAECGNLGAAILGAYGCKYFSSIEEAVDQMVHIKDTIEPDAKNISIYNEEYNIFKKTFHLLSENNIYKEISELQKNIGSF